MFHNKVKKVLTSCTFAITLSGLTILPAQADDTFILAQAMTTDHIFHASSEKFMEELRLQNSHYSAEYHPGGDLGDWTSQFEQAMMGVIPMTMTYGASEYDQRLDLTWLGYVVDSWDSAREAYGPNGPMLDVYNKILADNDLIALGLIPAGFGSITIRNGVGKTPTNFPEDAAGILMRVVPTPLGIARFKNWGFSAVPMPFSELYSSLQLGIVDGRAFGPAVEIWQMRDVLESYVMTRDYFEHAFWLVNKDWWEALPDDERAKMQASADKTMSWAWQEAEKIDNDYLNKISEYGINVVELSPQELNKAKEILYAKEWPYMEGIVGKDIMSLMRKIAGIH